MKLIYLFLATLVASVLLTPSAAHAAVNDFEITRYDMKLELARDEENRSTLRTSETITANFPAKDQNRGIERAIPKEYDGHGVSLNIESVTDETGASLEYSTNDDDNGNKIVRIGDEDTYVHGEQTYVLTYTQRDVTKETDELAEFYWDLNGTGWKVSIREFNAEIKVSDELMGAYRQSACYQGGAGADDRCELRAGEPGSYSVSAGGLLAGENVTVALGFTSGTFAPYEQSLAERLAIIWSIGLVVTGVVGLGLMIYASVRWSSWKNRKREIGTVVPEYIPPSSASVTTSAEVLDAPRTTLSAQLIDLAVRHYLKIYETKEKSAWMPAEYTLEIVKDITSLRPEEQELLRDLFENEVNVGQKLEMKKLRNNTSLYTRMQDNPEKLRKLVRGEYGLRKQKPEQTKWFTKLFWWMFAFSLLTLSPVLLLFAVSVYALGRTLWPLTDEGLMLRRYLEGLKLYIGVAEQERLKMLQAPETAEKVGGASEESPEKLVKLYEKVLPYAILFGQEKEWGAQLGRYYESLQQQPDWYAGNSNVAFTAVAMSSALSSFNTATSYTSASSSSGGGSGGGGSSGGGGGGGGGGGW